MWTWERITEFFEELAQDPRDSWKRMADHGKAMLDVIPQIRDSKYLGDIEPSLSLAAFCLAFPGKEAMIAIHSEGENTFSLSFFTRTDPTVTERRTVMQNELIPTLEAYKHKIYGEKVGERY